MTYRSAVGRADFHPDTAAFFAGRRVLVLGGSGFIGSHVVEQLIALRASPVVLTRRSDPPHLAHLGQAVELRRGSLEDRETAFAAMDGCSVVLNLAARVAGIGWNVTHPASMFVENMRLFFNALEAAAARKVDRFLVTSSACVYPRNCTVPTPEEEGFLDQPEPTNAGYGWAKRMEEFLGSSAATEYGLSVAIARPYNAFGPRDDFEPETSHVLPALIRKAVEAQGDSFPVWGDGSHSRSFLYVDDFARGLIEVAARHAVAAPLNLGAEEETTIGAAAEAIAVLVGQKRGRPLRPVFQPEGTTGQPRRACDTSRAKAAIGFRARVPLLEGLRRTIDWYHEHAHSALHSHP